MEKTMIFCVNTEHARDVTRLLNDFNTDLNVSDYAVCIVAEEGATGKALLEKFQNTAMNLPAVATTVDLLTTGVDAPSVRNIVFMKPIASVVSFKQIIGRGSRLCLDTEKFWFRIIDYTGATRLFDDWDKPSEPPEGGAETQPPFTCIVRGTVRDAETGQPIEHAHVFLQTGPNEIFDQFTGPTGEFQFAGVGKGQVVVVASAANYHRIQKTAVTDPAKPRTLELALKPVGKPKRKVKITGLQVSLVDETYEERDAEGNLVKPEDYLNKVREQLLAACHSMVELQKLWVASDRRDDLLKSLEERMVYVDILRAILQQPDADAFDLLAHVAFGADIHSCEERAAALFNLHRQFFEQFSPEAREVLQALVEKYRYGGVPKSPTLKSSRLRRSTATCARSPNGSAAWPNCVPRLMNSSVAFTFPKPLDSCRAKRSILNSGKPATFCGRTTTPTACWITSNKSPGCCSSNVSKNWSISAATKPSLRKSDTSPSSPRNITGRRGLTRKSVSRAATS